MTQGRGRPATGAPGRRRRRASRPSATSDPRSIGFGPTHSAHGKARARLTQRACRCSFGPACDPTWQCRRQTVHCNDTASRATPAAEAVATKRWLHFETAADSRESRVARDTAIAVRNAADNLQNKASAPAAAVRVVGRDLVTAASRRRPRPGRGLGRHPRRRGEPLRLDGRYRQVRPAGGTTTGRLSDDTFDPAGTSFTVKRILINAPSTPNTPVLAIDGGLPRGLAPHSPCTSAQTPPPSPPPTARARALYPCSCGPATACPGTDDSATASSAATLAMSATHLAESEGPYFDVRVTGTLAGTRLERVQARASLGDGILFRGGTAGCSRCVASGRGSRGRGLRRSVRRGELARGMDLGRPRAGLRRAGGGCRG